MRKGRGSAGGVVAALAVLIALVLASIAGGVQKPVGVQVGDLEVTFDGDLRPKALSKSRLTPVELEVAAKINTLSGSHPPALRQFSLDIDKNTAIDVNGYPVCKPQSRDSHAARSLCRSAILGEGKMTAQIAFPEEEPIPISSDLIIFNGGIHARVTTLFVHAYITVPRPTAIITTVKIKRVQKGRYGIRSVASVPRFAGGSGSVTSFSLTIDKKFASGGGHNSVVTAKCPSGTLLTRGEAIFSNGTRAMASIARICTQKGGRALSTSIPEVTVPQTPFAGSRYEAPIQPQRRTGRAADQGALLLTAPGFEQSDG